MNTVSGHCPKCHDRGYVFSWYPFLWVLLVYLGTDSVLRFLGYGQPISARYYVSNCFSIVIGVIALFPLLFTLFYPRAAFRRTCKHCNGPEKM